MNFALEEFRQVDCQVIKKSWELSDFTSLLPFQVGRPLYAAKTIKLLNFFILKFQ